MDVGRCSEQVDQVDQVEPTVVDVDDGRDIVAERRWAERGDWVVHQLDRAPWRWLNARRVAAVVGIVLLGLSLGFQYVAPRVSDSLVVDCMVEQPPGAQHVGSMWQWLPPGWVCVYDDGSEHAVRP